MQAKFILFFSGLLVAASMHQVCLGTNHLSGTKSTIILVGCTPGDDYIKSVLSIAPDYTVDFIKWQITINKNSASNFTLNIQYGESQPNTLGFKLGGSTKMIEGICTASDNPENDPGTIFHLKSNQLGHDLSLVRLNDNLFHILSAEQKLLVGNGGWSYTLNNTLPGGINNFPSMKLLTGMDTSLTIIYEGRTPCQDFAQEHHINVSQHCFKLKWKLILHRDPVSRQPSTYELRKIVDNEPKQVTGKWIEIKDPAGQPDKTIYQLDPETPRTAISLLVADENLLFFLHKDHSPFVGNDNFSYTLNKRKK